MGVQSVKAAPPLSPLSSDLIGTPAKWKAARPPTARQRLPAGPPHSPQQQSASHRWCARSRGGRSGPPSAGAAAWHCSGMGGPGCTSPGAASASLQGVEGQSSSGRQYLPRAQAESRWVQPGGEQSTQPVGQKPGLFSWEHPYFTKATPVAPSWFPLGNDGKNTNTRPVGGCLLIYPYIIHLAMKT